MPGIKMLERDLEKDESKRLRSADKDELGK
jgi:hypothetical protein